MMVDYRKMWQQLGLDLEAHDALLAGLEAGYRDIFLSQRQRPAAMGYFDAVVGGIHGQRIAELLAAKQEGRAVIGSFCVFVPEEIVLAVDAILVGLCTGADFALGEVEKILPRNTCALIKSAFGFKLSRVCPFLEAADLVVGENTCDGKKKAYEQLRELVPNLYVMDLPQQKTASGRWLLREEYRQFLAKVEELSGVEVTAERLRRGIELVNGKRQALERLAALRAADPAPISGLDALLVNQVSFYDDPARFTRAVNELNAELEDRVRRGTGVFPAGSPRLLLSGCPLAVPNWKLPGLIESSGAVVVGEESCVGERGWRRQVAAGGDTREEMLEAIVERYFMIDCAVFTPNLEREQHLREMARRCRADGIVHYGLQFCQPYLIESLPLEKRFRERGVNFLRVETDYSQEDVEQLRTRIEAFVEIVS